MSDTTTPTPPPDDVLARLKPYLDLITQGQAQPQRDTTPTQRSWQSKLGEWMGGGFAVPGMTDAEKEVAGRRALSDFGTGLLLSSGNLQGGTIGTALGRGFASAEHGLLGTEQMQAATYAAQQDWAKQQQELRINALKEALPLLKMQQGMETPNTLLGGGGASTVATPGTTPGTSISGVGGTEIKRDTSIPTVGQQANNPGNLTADSGAAPGSIGYVPAAGGRKVAAFPNVPTGVAAMSDNLAAYQAQHGINTIRGAVSRWVSDPKADLTSYVNDIAKAAGVDPDAPVNLSDPKIQRAFFIAQQPHESGGAWLKPDDVDAGIALATQRRLAAAGQPATPAPYKVAGPTMPPPTSSPGASVATPPVPAVPGGGQTLPASPPPAPAPAPAVQPSVVPGGGQTITQPPPSVVAPPTPAAAPAAAPATPESAPAAAPPGRLTFEQFQAQHPIIPSDADRQTWTVTPPDLAKAQAAQAEAARQLSLARAGISGDPNKSLSDYNTATQNLAKLQQDAQAKSLELQQKWRQDAINTQRQLYDAEMQRQQQADEADKQRAAAVALETQRGQQAIDIEKVKAGQNWHQKLQEQAAQAAQDNTLKPMAAMQQKAHQMNLGLAQMLPILQDLPASGGIMGTVLANRPELAPLFNSAGIIGDKQADAVRLINGLVANISTEMKPTGLGSLREYEWDAFKSQLPSMLSTKEGQLKAVALLMNMNNRISQEATWMNNYYSRPIPDETTPGRMVPAHNIEPDNAKEGVQERMDRELGPILKSYTGPPSASGQAEWEQSLPPGTPYLKSWSVTDPKTGRPQLDSRGNAVTKKTLEVRPWQ